MSFVSFLRQNAPWLAAGALLSFLSSFGQTFFIAIFAGEIRTTYGLSHGGWGSIYTLGTGASAVAVLWAGGLTDRFRVRALGSVVIAGLAVACVAMALNGSVLVLPVLVFLLRFFGQGMASHVAIVTMARWFTVNRGRALVVATFGFILGEASLPITFVWLKRFFDWQQLWLVAAAISVAMIPVLFLLLRQERQPQHANGNDAVAGMLGQHWTRGQALRHPLFWALIPAIMAFPAFGTAFWFHQVHFAAVKGWDHLSFVTVIPLGTAVFALSTFTYGWAIDRFGAARLMPFYLLPLVLAFGLHWYAPSLVWSAVAIMLMGVAGGGQATLPAACWAEFYGTRHLGAIKSTVAAFMVLGSALGPGLSGWLIDLGLDLPAQYLGYGLVFLVISVGMVGPVSRARSDLSSSH